MFPRKTLMHLLKIVLKRYDNNVKGIKLLMQDAGDSHYVMESTGIYGREAAICELGFTRKSTNMKNNEE